MSNYDDEGFDMGAVKLVAQTDRAYLVEFEEEEHWIPQSQVLWFEDCGVGEEGTLVIASWLAREKGWA